MPVDRYLAPDIARATALVHGGALARILRIAARLAGAVDAGLTLTPTST